MSSNQGSAGNAPAAGSPYDLNLQRTFAAPRELVFKAWTDPARLAAWWGPRGFTNPVCRFDARVGGEIYIDMQAPDGTVFPMGGTVDEIDPPSRLVFTSAALDQAGKPMFEVKTTAEFSEADGGTELNLSVRVVSAPAGAEVYLRGMEEGWSMSLDKLQEYLASQAA